MNCHCSYKNLMSARSNARKGWTPREQWQKRNVEQWKFLLLARVSKLVQLVTALQRSCPAFLLSELTRGSAFPTEFQCQSGIQPHTSLSRMWWSFLPAALLWSFTRHWALCLYEHDLNMDWYTPSSCHFRLQLCRVGWDSTSKTSKSYMWSLPTCSD